MKKNDILSKEEKEYLKNQYLHVFIDCKNNYIDDIPDKSFSVDDPNIKKYKCRIEFFIRISTLALDLAHILEVSDPETVVRLQSFSSFVNLLVNKNIPENQPLTRKEVEEVNIFLDYLITKFNISLS